MVYRFYPASDWCPQNGYMYCGSHCENCNTVHGREQQRCLNKTQESIVGYNSGCVTPRGGFHPPPPHPHPTHLSPTPHHHPHPPSPPPSPPPTSSPPSPTSSPNAFSSYSITLTHILTTHHPQPSPLWHGCGGCTPNTFSSYSSSSSSS